MHFTCEECKHIKRGRLCISQKDWDACAQARIASIAIHDRSCKHLNLGVGFTSWICTICIAEWADNNFLSGVKHTLDVECDTMREAVEKSKTWWYFPRIPTRCRIFYCTRSRDFSHLCDVFREITARVSPRQEFICLSKSSSMLLLLTVGH